MSKSIRIGTRDSQLALWQAKTVQQQLEHLGHKTVIVPVKSTGDLDVTTPLYELGITGIFTKALDIALLNDTIDIAVHSLKDVPTILPKGIVQAAVLKRGNVRDTLVFKHNEEFLAQKNAVIATGSLRRKAQWLNRYPTHTVVDLRGNVNSRLQKLEDNKWNGAIFAAAGIGRLGITPEEAINLEWMVPAPGQGAIMIATLDSNDAIKTICAELNHEETEICTHIERQFLNRLEGGCSAPIGALAFIKNEEITFQGVLLSLDGSKKIEVKRVEKLGSHHNMVNFCVDYILDRGGNRLMDDIKLSGKPTQIYSTKKLTDAQRQLFKDDVVVDSDDFIKISLNRIPKPILKSTINNVVITSQNAVEAIVTSVSADELQFKNIYCVGRKTKKLIEQKIGKVIHYENDAKKLADYLLEYMDGTEITHFCSNIRLDTLSETLAEQNIKVNDVEAYQTVLSPKEIETTVEGVLFYSPSNVQSYMQKNFPNENTIAYCIGDTTATEAKKHFKTIKIAKVPTVESVIALVNENYL